MGNYIGNLDRLLDDIFKIKAKNTDSIILTCSESTIKDVIGYRGQLPYSGTSGRLFGTKTFVDNTLRCGEIKIFTESI